jgi:23S rRNA pseudouridine2605 synthase
MSTRINRYIAQATGLSRRAADTAIQQGRVLFNGQPAKLGDSVAVGDTVTFDGKELKPTAKLTTILFNKPVGYVCSREGQGNRTIYELLPPELHELKPVGRLDKNSSGLLLLTNDGQLAHQLTHPGFQKKKIYQVVLSKPLAPEDQRRVAQGIQLEDGISLLQLKGEGKEWRVTMYEGRNRQIRRTFEAIGYDVRTLHRTSFGDFNLHDLQNAKYKTLI